MPHVCEYDRVKTFEDAIKVCEAKGGYLAIINDPAENEKLFQYMKNMDYDIAYFGMILRDDGEWVYYNGKTINYKDWVPYPWGVNNAGDDEPNHYGGFEGNVCLDSHMKEEYGHWNDAVFGTWIFTPPPEGKRYKNLCPFICEWDI